MCTNMARFLLFLLCLTASCYADPKILVLIIASDDLPVYKELQTIWKGYMHRDPEHIEAYFLRADPHLNTPYAIHEDVIWSKTEESLAPGVLNKTLLSLECLYSRLDEFDYVVRTNLSSFYNFPRLLDYVKTLPAASCYAAFRGNHGGISFGGGAGIIFSRDLVKKLVERKEELLNHYLPDDVAIGLFMQQEDVQLIDAPRTDFLSLGDWNSFGHAIPHHAFHFRVKNNDPALRLTDEVYVQKQLYNMFYGAPLKFFNLDMHISVIADVKDVFERYGHQVDAWSISGHTWVFGKSRDQVEVFNEHTAHLLNQEMCDRFYERYKDELKGYDAFIVTHTPSSALLYEKWGKPIIIVNSTRYEFPFTTKPEEWQWLNDYLRKGVEKGRIFIVSNNKGDQSYLKYYTGLDSELIPSLCEYTHATYTGRKKGFIFRSWAISRFINQVDPEWIQNIRLPHPYSWQELYDFQGIVHFPYQISTMSLFEQYTANVPLFFPTKRFLYELYQRNPDIILAQLSYGPSSGRLNAIHDPAVIQFWIDAADYYDPENMPFIQYFDSFPELEFLFCTCDLQSISQSMQLHNLSRKQKILAQWETILRKLLNVYN